MISALFVESDLSLKEKTGVKNARKDMKNELKNGWMKVEVLKKQYGWTK